MTTTRPVPLFAVTGRESPPCPRISGPFITVALVSIAEGMAYALVAGVAPIYGLWAGSVTVIVGSLLASSTLLMVTATNPLALVAADQIGALGGALGRRSWSEGDAGKIGIANLVGLDNIVWHDEILGRAIDVAYDRATALLSDQPVSDPPGD